MPNEATVAELTESLTKLAATHDQIQAEIETIKSQAPFSKGKEMGDDLEELKKFRATTEEAMKSFVDLGANVTEVKEQNERLKKQLEAFSDDYETEKNKNVVPGFDDDEKAIEKFNCLSYAVACAKMNRPNSSAEEAWKDAGYEKEVMTELARKPDFVKSYNGDDSMALEHDGDFSKAPVARGISDATGQVMFPIGVSAMLITQIFTQSVAGRLGCTHMDGLFMGRNRRYQIPKLAVSGGAVENEGEVIALGDNTFSMIELVPYKVAGRWQMTNESLISITPSQGMAFRQAITDQIRTVAEVLMFTGTGVKTDGQPNENHAGSQPKGIKKLIVSANEIASGTNGDAVSGILGMLETFPDLLDDNNTSELPGMRFLMARRLYRRIITSSFPHVASSAEEYQFPMAVISGAIDGWLGYPMVQSNYVGTKETKGTAKSKTTTLYLGHWPSHIVATGRTLRVGENPYLADAWTKDSIDIRVLMELDFQNMRDDAFVYRQGIIVR